MATPQQPELARSGHHAVDPGAPATDLTAPSAPGVDGGGDGRVPEANRPGHHPDHEQDKPDPAAFVARAKAVAARDAGPEDGGGATTAPEPERATGSTQAAPAVARPPADRAPAPGPHDPLATLLVLPWRVATLPLRVAIGGLGRARRLVEGAIRR